MKATNKILFSVGLIASAVSAAAAEKLSPDDLPTAVKQSVDRERGGDPVKQVSSEVVDGRTIYLVEIEKENAPNPRLRITEEGKLLPGPEPGMTPGGAGAPIVPEAYAGGDTVGRALTLADLPEAVQAVVRGHAAGRDIVDIDRETWGEEVVFEIEFRERGPNSHLYLDKDGNVVRDEQAATGGVRPRFLGIQVDDTPPAVQKTIRRLVDEKEIADIDKKTERGRTVYRVDVRGYYGRRELKIGLDGKVVSDAREPAPPR